MYEKDVWDRAIVVYPHLRRSAESSSCRASLSFRRKSLHYIARLLHEISDRAFSISAGSAEENKEVSRKGNEEEETDCISFCMEICMERIWKLHKSWDCDERNRHQNIFANLLDMLFSE